MSELERRRDPGPSGSEYAEHREHDRTRNALAGLLLFLVLVLALLSTYGAFVTGPNDARNVAEEIRQGQYNACIKVGNALRDDIRNEFIDLKESVLIPVFSGVAQTIPDNVPSKPILEDSVSYMQRRIKTIDQRIPDTDCMDVYPPLEGQTFH